MSGAVISAKGCYNCPFAHTRGSVAFVEPHHYMVCYLLEAVNDASGVLESWYTSYQGHVPEACPLLEGKVMVGLDIASLETKHE